MMCDICCFEKQEENINFQCPYCSEKCCLDCFKQSLLGWERAQCLFCKTLLTMEFVINTTLRPWIKKVYLPYLCRQRIQTEKQLLFQNQEEAKIILQLRQLRKEFAQIPTLKKIKKKCESKLEETRQKQLEKRTEINQLKKLLMSSSESSSVVPKTFRFVGFCPRSDCKGTLNENFTCPLCDTKTCQECGEMLAVDNTHQCVEETKQSYRSIQRDSKPCPQCRVPIFQISGCDQMWCVYCQTPFSWATGEKIVHGAIHNPHYYEWLFQNRLEDHGQNRIVLNCQEFPTVQELNYFLYQHYPTDNHYPWWKLHRNIIHLREVVLPKFRQDRDRQMDYKSLRLQYLVGDVDEERWCELLQIRQEKQMKLSALFELTQLVADLFTDLISRLISLQQPIPGREEIINVWNFAQDSGERICQIYGGKMPTVWPKDFEF